MQKRVENTFSQERLEKIVADSKLAQAELRKQRLDREAAGLKPVPLHLLGKGDSAIRKWESNQEQRDIKGKYGLNFFVGKSAYPKLMKLLRQVNSGSRLHENDVVWLTAKGYFTDRLKQVYHSNEAKHFREKFNKSNDYWDAVNASSHYRQSKEPEKADTFLSGIDVAHLRKPDRLKAALWTTHGGVKRDLDDREGALELAMLAHNIAPSSFMPCTLIGAINIERGHYAEGGHWYEKAIQRGFTDRKMDSELRTIFNRASKEDKANLKKYLLGIDPHRYSWVNGKKQARQRCG